MYILSGSQRKKLLDESKESLSGRVGIIDMNNLSLNEILSLDNTPFKVDFTNIYNRAKRFNINENQIFDYIVRGFFPVLYDDKELSAQLFYSSYVSTYL